MNVYNGRRKGRSLGWCSGLTWHGALLFETDAYLYVGEDKLWKLSLETERDLLLLKS